MLIYPMFRSLYTYMLYVIRRLYIIRSCSLAGIEIDKITTTSGYNQMIDKPIHYIMEL